MCRLSRVPAPQLAHRLWVVGRRWRCLQCCLDQAVLLLRCGERRGKEVFLFLATFFSPFLRQFFSPPQVLSSFPQALSFSPRAFPPSLPRGLSFLPVAALNHRLLQPLPRSSPPGLRALSFPAGPLSLQQFRWKPCRFRA